VAVTDFTGDGMSSEADGLVVRGRTHSTHIYHAQLTLSLLQHCSKLSLTALHSSSQRSVRELTAAVGYRHAGWCRRCAPAS
jgi:hypothetical protein